MRTFPLLYAFLLAPFIFAQDYDLLIRGGRIVDGTGNPSFIGDIAIRNQQIVAMGHLGSSTAGRTIDVTGLTVAPGFIDTPMTQGLSADVKDLLQKQIPLGRLGQPSDVAAAVRFLVSDDAGYITGQVIHVNGGMLMA